MRFTFRRAPASCRDVFHSTASTGICRRQDVATIASAVPQRDHVLRTNRVPMIDASRSLCGKLCKYFERHVPQRASPSLVDPAPRVVLDTRLDCVVQVGL